MKKLQGKRLHSFTSAIFLTIYALIILVPILWMLSTAFKLESQAYAVPPVWIPIPITLDNFRRLYNAFPYFQFMRNTISITVIILSFQLSLGVLAAYAFARLTFPGRDILFLTLLSSLMIPHSITMLPQYLIVNWLGWLNTYTGVVVPLIFMNVFGIFLLRQYFLGFPRDFEDAAKIDGAGVVKTFLLVMLPQVRPALATVAVLSFMRSNRFGSQSE